MASKRGGRASAALTALVLDTYGRQCHLRLKGCTGIATTKDHIIPYANGGSDVLENFRPACKRCNSKRQNKVITGYGASVVVIIGPPAAGKSHYVEEHAAPNDLVIDMDKIARALMPHTPDRTHIYPDHVRNVAIKARSTAIHHATRLRERVTVWFISAIPRPDDLADYKRLGWQVITIDPGRDIVEPRCRQLRPPEQLKQVARWYATYGHETIDPEQLTTTPQNDEPDW